MSVICITAPPGGGKTLNLTYEGIKLYEKENPLFKRIRKKYVHIVNIYSNYPILLHYQNKPFYFDRGNGKERSVPLKLTYDKDLCQEYYQVCDEKDAEKYGVFSNKINFTDLRIKYRFNYNSSFLIDEIQYIYDSQEYKDFPDCISHFFQIHRHLSYNRIYVNSQSLSRIIKKVLNVSEEFWNIISYKQGSIFKGLSKTTYKITYDINESKYSENAVNDYNIVRIQRFFNRRVYKGYITRYLGSLNDTLPYYPSVGFESLKMPKNDILKSFIVSDDTKEELKRQVF